MFRIQNVNVSIFKTLIVVLCAVALLFLTCNYLVNQGPLQPPGGSSRASPAKDIRSKYGRIRESHPADALHRRKEEASWADEERNRKSSDVFVVILAQWRFGSSIIGELFNQNPSMFYVYEPLWVFSKEAASLDQELSHIYDYQLSPKDNYRRILKAIPNCDFSEDFVKVINTYGGKLRNKLICENTVDVENCNISDANWLDSVCKRSGGRVATKLIRLDLDTIKPLIVNDNINVKIVNVVRDPRGAAASRIHYDLVLNHRAFDLVALSDQIPKQGRLEPLGYLTNVRPTAESLPAMCDLMRTNFQRASDLPFWLSNRYKLIRFEDFAEDPVGVAREIYDFVGIPLPSSVEEWVTDHTKVKLEQEEESNVFSTRKNAKDVAKSWMTDLTELEIRQVEDICQESMQLLGYKAYDELKKLKSE